MYPGGRDLWDIFREKHYNTFQTNIFIDLVGDVHYYSASEIESIIKSNS